MIPIRSKKAFVIALVVIAAVVFVLPALAAYRYTAPQQRGDFITHPWRGWSFALAALRVPADSRLKTSGMALRKADWLLRGSAIDPHAVQLLVVGPDSPHTFSQQIAGRTVTATVTPSYRFIWQVQGAIRTLPGHEDSIVLLLDYASGRVLYDVRRDLLPSQVSPTPSPAPVPSGEPTVPAVPSPAT